MALGNLQVFSSFRWNDWLIKWVFKDFFSMNVSKYLKYDFKTLLIEVCFVLSHHVQNYKYGVGLRPAL